MKPSTDNNLQTQQTSGQDKVCKSGVASIVDQEWWQPENFREKLERIETTSRYEDHLPNKEESEEMLRSGDNFHFRMAAVALGFDPYLLSGNLTSQQDGATILGAGGVTYASFGKNIVILLPDIKNSQQNERVLEDLLEIYDSPRGRHSNWIVDFSALTNRPPVMLIGVLKGYLNDLNRNGATVSLAWLRPSLLKGTLLELTKRAFKLKEIGGYLFPDFRIGTPEPRLELQKGRLLRGQVQERGMRTLRIR